MATDTDPGPSNAPSTTGGGDDCPDPADAFVALQLWFAQDFAVCDRRKVALEAMTARVASVAGLQVAYEDALNAQRAALAQLLQDLKSMRTTVECLVPDDRQRCLVDCFCQRVEDDDDEAQLDPIPDDDPCPSAETSEIDDLEELRRKLTTIRRLIDQRGKALDELTGLPGTVKAEVDALAAKVKDLNQKICDKSIDAERAFVMQLQFRREYVELRHLLTDSRTFVCHIYHLVDELFVLYEQDICLAGAIARLEKEDALAEEREKDEAKFIDDILRCAKPEDPSKPPDDDSDDVDDLDPCACHGETEPPPPTGEPEPTYPGGKGDAGQYPPTGQQPPPTGQYPAEPPTGQYPTDPPAGRPPPSDPYQEQQPPSSHQQPPSTQPPTAR